MIGWRNWRGACALDVCSFIVEYWRVYYKIPGTQGSVGVYYREKLHAVEFKSYSENIKRYFKMWILLNNKVSTRDKKVKLEHWKIGFIRSQHKLKFYLCQYFVIKRFPDTALKPLNSLDCRCRLTIKYKALNETKKSGYSILLSDKRNAFFLIFAIIEFFAIIVHETCIKAFWHHIFKGIHCYYRFFIMVIVILRENDCL